MALTPELVARAFRVEPELPPGNGFTRASEAEQAALTERMLLDRADAPIWVFAYGSLIWKPVFTPDEVRVGIASGWHRAFTLRLESFRATPDRPGLMMALAPGGRCSGLLLRLPQADRRGALTALIDREVPFLEVRSMIRWISVQTEAGPVRALVFWAGDCPPHTVRGLSPEETARRIARACGHVGSCADYLYQTVSHLESVGIRDRNLWRLQALVATELAAWPADPPRATGDSVAAAPCAAWVDGPRDPENHAYAPCMDCAWVVQTGNRRILSPLTSRSRRRRSALRPTRPPAR